MHMPLLMRYSYSKSTGPFLILLSGESNQKIDSEVLGNFVMLATSSGEVGYSELYSHQGMIMAQQTDVEERIKGRGRET